MGRKICNLAREKQSDVFMVCRYYQKIKLMQKENAEFLFESEVHEYFWCYTAVGGGGEGGGRGQDSVNLWERKPWSPVPTMSWGQEGEEAQTQVRKHVCVPL